MKVLKRDGTLEMFNPNKIISAVEAAYKSQGKTIGSDVLLSLKGIINVHGEVISVETIQDKVEKILIDLAPYDVAKSYIIYREAHKNIRDQAQNMWEFIQNFVKSDNTANATIDDNSNVGTKGIGVLNAEIHKTANKNTNMYLWEMAVKKLFPEVSIKKMRKDFNTILYAHDSSSQVLMPYCMAVSMYPFLLNGLKDLGGKSAVPRNIDSFCGIYVNLVFALASEVKGAVATPEFLMYMDYFCRKEWGEEYYLKSDAVISSDYCNRHKTIGSQIDQYFQQVTYSINQIAGSRGMQSPFVNFSFFDKYFFEGMFGEFLFPDKTKPVWESTNWLQQRYLHWLNQERLKCILTFPVCSYACLIENNTLKDSDAFKFICKEYSEGNSFFTYLSESVDSLSSCCRLQNAVQENTFSTTNGQIGVMTGSKQVITLDLNRIIQDWKGSCVTSTNWQESLSNYLRKVLKDVYKYHRAYNALLHWAKDNNLYAAYSAGFIDLDKQYLTIGINGLNQAAEFLGIECNNNIKYKEFCSLIFSTISEENKKHRTKHERFNTEQVPAESAAIKLYNRDKKDGYWVPEDTNLYASYIFKPNDANISILDKIILHSEQFASNKLDGGSAAHLNLDAHLSIKQYEQLLNFAAKQKCKYFTFNVPNAECEDCGYITKNPITKCPKCGSTKISLWDRVIGYLTKINNWSKGRQEEQKIRVYAKISRDTDNIQ